MSAPYLQELDAAPEVATLEGPEWLDAIRRAARDRFAQVGFPTTRDEEWRFTPVTPIAQGDFRPATGGAEVRREDLAPFVFGHPEWPLVVFVNGRFRADLSVLPALPAGVRIGSLAELLAGDGASLEPHLARYAPIEGSPFTALNTALVRDGAVVTVADGVDFTTPIHLLFVAAGDAEGTAAHPRTLVIVGRNARASLVESYIALVPGTRYFTNTVAEVVVGENSWVEHARIQRESEAAYHVALTQVEQGRDSHYRSFSLAMGGALARHNLHCRLNAPNVETLMYGLYLTHGEQLVDNHTAIFHDHPNCRSWEVYKGVLEGRSRAVFNGKVFVKPEAQQTDAKQTNRNLLLSDEAKVDTKPQLEIFADDVKCTHGATVGRLDDVALFYARSRGIGEREAKRLLTYAFAAEVVDEVSIEPVRNELNRLVLERLEALG